MGEGWRTVAVKTGVASHPDFHPEFRERMPGLRRLHGCWIVDTVHAGLLLIAAAGFIQLRRLCNLFDGMVAVEGGFKTKSGELYNDLPDRFSGALILAGKDAGPAPDWAIRQPEHDLGGFPGRDCDRDLDRSRAVGLPPSGRSQASISFKGTLDTLRHWANLIDSKRRRPKLQDQLVDEMLRIIAGDLVQLRPGRSEPRAVKRRPKNYHHLTKPRHQMGNLPHRNRPGKSWRRRSPKTVLI